MKEALAQVFAEISSDDTDAVAAEAFELLEPIPVELASAMIGALTATDNQPLGKQSEPEQASAGGRQAAGGAPAPASTPVPKTRGFSRYYVYLLIAVGIMMARAIVRRRTGKG